MKTITEELIRKHLGNAVTIRRGWFGKWNLSNPTTGLEGHVSSKSLEIRVSDADVAKESYVPFSRLICDMFCNEDNSPELNEILAEHFAKAFCLQDKWKLKKFWSPLLPKAKAEKRITKERLVWHLDELGLKSIRRKIFGGFVMRMVSGRRIDLKKAGFDFRKSPNELMPGEKEGYVGSVKWECAQIGEDVWGGISFPTLTGQELLDTAAAAEKCGFTVGDDQARIAEFFGAEAKVKWLWGRGFRVVMPDGSSIHISGGIQEVNGDSALYARTMKFGQAVMEGKPLIVSGTQENVLAGIAHAEQLGIEIIPELYPKRIYEAVGFVTAIVCGVIGGCWFNSLDGFLGGYFGSMLISPFVAAALSGPMQRSARRRGHLLRSRFPQIHGGERKAAIEDAKARGMI